MYSRIAVVYGLSLDLCLVPKHILNISSKVESRQVCLYIQWSIKLKQYPFNYRVYDSPIKKKSSGQRQNVFTAATLR